MPDPLPFRLHCIQPALNVARRRSIGGFASLISMARLCQLAADIVPF